MVAEYAGGPMSEESNKLCMQQNIQGDNFYRFRVLQTGCKSFLFIHFLTGHTLAKDWRTYGF